MKNAIRTYMEVGKTEGYSKESIDESINFIKWEVFRKENIPFSQGYALQEVFRSCRIPISTINNMFLYGVIKNGKEQHSFYAIDVQYDNGNAKIYMADNGIKVVILASDFLAN